MRPTFPQFVNKCGIYGIRHRESRKIYVGKSKNIGRRFTQYFYDIKNNRRRHVNEYLMNAFLKYGIDAFDFMILEEAEFALLSDRELFWMNKLNSTDRNYGYNLRMDSSSGGTVVDSTRQKISNRLKFEWASGKRAGHSDKLKESWKDRDRNAQGKLFSKILTKYVYIVTRGDVIESLSYAELKQAGYNSILSTFHRKGCDSGYLKGAYIRREKVDG